MIEHDQSERGLRGSRLWIALVVAAVVGSLVIAMDIAAEIQVERRYRDMQAWFDDDPPRAVARRQLWAGGEALALDDGQIAPGEHGVAIVARVTGVAPAVIRAERDHVRVYQENHPSCLPMYRGGRTYVVLGLRGIAAGVAFVLALIYSAALVVRPAHRSV